MAQFSLFSLRVNDSRPGRLRWTWELMINCWHLAFLASLALIPIYVTITQILRVTLATPYPARASESERARASSARSGRLRLAVSLHGIDTN